jgi:ECF sigma factor
MAREWRASGYQTTALVSEAYMTLVGQREMHWQNGAHLFAIAAHVMRRILVDCARHELRPKHAAGLVSAPLRDVDAVAAEKPAIDRVDRSLSMPRFASSKRSTPIKPGGRVAVLRWADHRRDRGGHAGFRDDGETRMGDHEGLSVS